MRSGQAKTVEPETKQAAAPRNGQTSSAKPKVQTKTDERHGEGVARGVVPAHRQQLQADRAIEVVILVGVPGSGKTSFFRDRYAHTHEHISKDLFPRHARHRGVRQATLLAGALVAGRSVVIDNTNVSREERAEAIHLGRAHGARVVGYYFDTPVRMCVARNARREGHARVPNVAIFAAAKRLVAPRCEEGFDELHRVIPLGEGVIVEPLGSTSAARHVASQESSRSSRGPQRRSRLRVKKT